MAYMKNPDKDDDEEGTLKQTEDDKKEDRVPTEEDLQQGLAMLELYKQQMEALAREAERLGASMQDHGRAIETLEAMGKMSKPTEMLVPIGAGVFINVKPTSTKKTIMKVGVGISAEYDVEQALEKVNGSVKAMEEREKKVITDLQKVERTAQALSQQLQAMYERMQQANR